MIIREIEMQLSLSIHRFIVLFELKILSWKINIFKHMEIGIIGIIISKMLPHALAFFLSDLIRLKQESDFNKNESSS